MTRYLKVEISQALFTTLARDGRAAGFLALLFSKMDIVEGGGEHGEAQPAVNWRVTWGCDLDGLPEAARAAVEDSLAAVQASRPLADFGADADGV